MDARLFPPPAQIDISEKTVFFIPLRWCRMVISQHCTHASVHYKALKAEELFLLLIINEVIIKLCIDVP